MTQVKRAFLLCVCLVLLLTMGGGIILSAFVVRADAATVQYSSALEDLEKDETFDAAQYPAKADDYSLQIIQIAEGDKGELFVYAYQPSNGNKDYRASYINMSLQDRTNQSPTYQLYSLTWLGSDGVFSKYKVDGFSMSSELYRYYNIATIYRAFDASVDDPAEASDDVNEHIGYSVGRCYCAYYYNGTVVYECEKVDVVDVEILAVGSVRFTEGFKLYVDKCDAHFVAFSVENFDVDKIYDATVVYTAQPYVWSFVLGVGESENPNGDPITTPREISTMETASNDGDGLLGVKYEWQRIVTKDEFEAQLEDFKNEDVVFSKGDLGNAEFVFQFLETDYTLSSGNGNTLKYFTKVTDVGILRLHFLSGVNTYNLGVVSDLVSDDGNPDFEVTIGDNFENQDWWQKIIALLMLILLVAFLGPFLMPLLSVVMNIVWFAIKALFSFLLWAIGIPFKLFGLLFRGK